VALRIARTFFNPVIHSRQEPKRKQSHPHEEHIMKLSARNSLPGTIRKIEPGAVNAEVTIELAPGLQVYSIITLDAVKDLGLKVGSPAYAVIKASSVMVGVD
jgi:molybdopterin-binding protein